MIVVIDIVPKQIINLFNSIFKRNRLSYKEANNKCEQNTQVEVHALVFLYKNKLK